ncbi:ABC transporter ATP-binding protein [Spongiibacter sp.]|uniref:ABC transporter ATP-binding protein n=1 Tax=Spongiibacter sp. TaxID=2024860 RepID=UPI00257E1542|nr:ABC transporter ATP-binding protein [Spongiibacter sp.]
MNTAPIAAEMAGPQQVRQPPPLLEIDRLSIEFSTRQGIVRAVEEVSWTLAPGEMLGIVGESGSGKSVSTLALMGLLDDNGLIAGGQMRYRGQLLGGDAAKDYALRSRMAMIFQYPRLALNPIRRVGQQIMDVLRAIGEPGNKQALKARTLALLEEVQISQPEQRFYAYPFELSGGMCQRILIAMALARSPDLLVADEPTTGLDVVTQEAILALIADAARRRQMATLFITHDLGLAAKHCQRIVVMQKGRVVESAPAGTLFAAPKEAYTRALIAATPALMKNLDQLRAVYQQQAEEMAS